MSFKILIGTSHLYYFLFLKVFEIKKRFTTLRKTINYWEVATSFTFIPSCFLLLIPVYYLISSKYIYKRKKYCFNENTIQLIFDIIRTYTLMESKGIYNVQVKRLLNYGLIPSEHIYIIKMVVQWIEQWSSRVIVWAVDLRINVLDWVQFE